MDKEVKRTNKEIRRGKYGIIRLNNADLEGTIKTLQDG